MFILLYFISFYLFSHTCAINTFSPCFASLFSLPLGSPCKCFSFAPAVMSPCETVPDHRPPDSPPSSKADASQVLFVCAEHSKLKNVFTVPVSILAPQSGVVFEGSGCRLCLEVLGSSGWPYTWWSLGVGDDTEFPSEAACLWLVS